MTTINNDTIDDTIDDTIPRQNMTLNKCGFDKATLKRREIELIALQKLYPNMPLHFIEVAWNWHESHTLEEQNDIILSGVMDKPSSRDGKGGVIKNAFIIEKSESIECI